MTEIELDPNLLVTLQELRSHAVEYVLVGEIAEAIHNGGGFVSGLEIVPGSYGRNVDRLAYALKALDAHTTSGQPVDIRVTDLRAAAPCTFKTRYATIALDFAPGGTNGYRDLFADAARHRLGAGVNPHVASPADLDRIDEWARNRPGAVPPAVPPAVAPAVLAPEPEPEPDDEGAPRGRAAAVLPPEPDGWPQEIRASRASRA